MCFKVYCEEIKKTNHRMGENICKSYIWLKTKICKELDACKYIFRICQEFLQKKNKKANNSVNNGWRLWIFLQMQMANKHMKNAQCL